MKVEINKVRGGCYEWLSSWLQRVIPVPEWYLFE